jgi:hypothetical protein
MTDTAPAQADDDLAAELDDDTNDPADVDANADEHRPIHYFTGRVESGPQPYPGKLLVSRFPSGVLLVDRVAGQAWVLDFDPSGGIYRCRDSAGAPLDESGRLRAAEEPNYEVRAYDPVFAGDEPVDVAACDVGGCDDDFGAPA